MTASRIEYRVLSADDVPALRTFLEPRIASSMFLLSNLRDGGIDDRGEQYQGTYVGAFAGGRLVGVVAHNWNGLWMMQAPHHIAPLLTLLAQSSERELSGMIGPADQIDSAEAWLQQRGASPDVRYTEAGGLYELPLAQLIMPAALEAGAVQGRPARQDDFKLLVQWDVAYQVEALHATEDEALRTQSREGVQRCIDDGSCWIAVRDGVPVACTGFNARLPEAVQIGGVWTPPELRGRGYARCAVAASLLDARAEGVERAILFTGDDNVPAIRSYAALGFKRVGDYRLMLFAQPLPRRRSATRFCAGTGSESRNRARSGRLNVNEGELP